MSNKWDIYCRTCNDYAGLEWNHKRDEIRVLLEHRAAIAKLIAVEDELRPLLPLGVSVDLSAGADCYAVPLHFFRVHGEHDLVPIDEYDVIDGLCAKSWQCAAPGCRTWHRCGLEDGHAGPCGPAPEGGAS